MAVATHRTVLAMQLTLAEVERLAAINFSAGVLQDCSGRKYSFEWGLRQRRSRSAVEIELIEKHVQHPSHIAWADDFQRGLAGKRLARL